MTNAVDLCVSNKYYNSALKLIYAAVDNLAYLATNHQTVHKPDFISWIDELLLPTSDLSCTAEELYAQRCGLLHQNMAATNNLSSGMKSILYTWGTAQPEKLLDHIDVSRRDLYRCISLESLQNAMYQGMIKFLGKVSESTTQKDRLLKRAEKYFTNIDDNTI